MNQQQINPYEKFKQVDEVDTVTQLNRRLKEGWKLIWIYNRVYQTDSVGVSTQYPVYVIGRE